MLKKLFDYGVRKAIDWYFRVRSAQTLLITGGVTLLVAAIAGLPFIIFIARSALGLGPDELHGFVDTVDGLKILVGIVGGIMVAGGLTLAFLSWFEGQTSRSSKRVIVVEARGLRLDRGTPLLAALGEEFVGQKTENLIDLMDRDDGKAIDPTAAISEIEEAYSTVKRVKKSISPADLKLVYGGLAPVPFTFLTGVLFDDEAEIIAFDWDRTTEGWRALIDDDDGSGFAVEGVDGDIEGTDAVVAVSYSYPVSNDALTNTFAMPIVRLTLDGFSSDAHWSQAKQSRLAQQFFEVAKQLSAKGIKRIHLVLAAPNSVVFTFGRRYDKRNLPAVSVYQFEGGATPAYPWSIVMPVSDTDRARVSTPSDFTT